MPYCKQAQSQREASGAEPGLFTYSIHIYHSDKLLYFFRAEGVKWERELAYTDFIVPVTGREHYEEGRYILH